MKDIKLLIVEDEILVSLQMKDILHKLGISNVDTASEADEAVELAKQNRYSVILMDIYLKGVKTGIDAAKEILDIYNTNIIYISGNSDTKTMSKARETEHYDYILKPIDMRKLSESIRAAAQSA